MPFLQSVLSENKLSKFSVDKIVIDFIITAE